jgi:hypothetical protein
VDGEISAPNRSRNFGTTRHAALRSDRVRRLPALILGVVAGAAGLFASGALAGPPAGVSSQVIPAYGISLEVPSSWFPESPPESIVAYYFVAPDGLYGFRPNLTLVVLSLPHGMTLSGLLHAGAGAALLRTGTLTPVTVGGSPGLHFSSTKATKYGTVALLTDEYAVARKGRVFLFTYTAPASMRSLFGPVFRRSAASIRFGAHAPPPGAYGG